MINLSEIISYIDIDYDRRIVLMKKVLLVMLMTTLLVGCETVTRNDAPNLGKKLGVAKNADQVVMLADLDDYGRANFYLSYQYYISHDIDVALQKAAIVMKRYPKFPEGYNLLGVIEEDRGRTDIALAHYKTAFELNPTYTIALSNYARVMCQKGLSAMESEIQHNSKAHAGMYAAVGECAVRNSQYPVALRYADMAIKSNPEYGQSFFVRAVALKEMDDISSALVALEQFHNLNGYTSNSLQLGIEMAQKVNNTSALQKYNLAMQQFTNPAN